MADPALRRAKNIRNSPRWQRFRGWLRRQHPLCCDPFGHHAEDGMAALTEHVHHIFPLSSDEGVRLACTESNTAPLCVSCHGKIEGMERAGKPTRQLFAAFVGTLRGDEP